MTIEEARRIISVKKSEYGDRLVILGHHYQTDEIIEYADYIGDSLELAKIASRIKKADFIVFCGVYFMAETASIVASGKEVYIPDNNAGCPLADMADIEEVSVAWEHITEINKSVVPLTYINSTALTKAFCGRNAGSVCTSGNAEKMFEWAMARAEKIFFMPDMNLGRNTARAMGIPDERIVLWDPSKNMGGLDKESILQAKVILWKGWCPVHWPELNSKDVVSLRTRYPGIKIIVHPESDPETVKNCDAAASTAGILRYIASLKLGEKVAVGTEYNMVSRAAHSYHSLVDIIPLKRVFCEDMAKITLEKLAVTLSGIGSMDQRVIVPEEIAKDAKKGLVEMLKV